ncbi:MAG TPA: hypothetical protein VNA69_23135 [Thermoanaerobaculia bacterium]|nr:hypothetical protein [Thermoanaerobaculia bacterium]
MSHDADIPGEQRFIEEQGATEEQTDKIDAIVGDEVLGYDGSGRGEHSGQESVPTSDRITDALANNRPEQVK